MEHYNSIDKLASLIENNITSGLSGSRSNLNLSKELIEDTIILERLNILNLYFLKGITKWDDLYISINCIPIDCQPIAKCRCGRELCNNPEIAHFEIPLLFIDSNQKSIRYIGSTDRMNPFSVYTNTMSLNNSKYKKRKKKTPIVFIDTTPNKNGYYDGFIFNAPLLEAISITAIFKDLRQLDKFNCCESNYNENTNALDAEIVNSVTEKLIRWYKQGYIQPRPNNQEYAIG